MDCVFCKIVNGDLPMFKIYEDEFTLAFLDISNDVDGHTVVIPKKHFVSILDIDAGTLEKFTLSVQKIARHYTSNCGFSGVNVLNANGASAGQSVFHLHFHIFPRKENDGASLWPENNQAKLSKEEVQKLLKLN